MARNIEIKARVPDLDAVRTRAARLASRPVERLDHVDTFFVVPDGRLKVREFAGGSGELIAYQRPDQPGPKASDYVRCPCPSARALVEALSHVLPVRGVVRKRRDVFLVGRTRVHLDEVDGLGRFVELEVVLEDGEPAETGEQIAHDLLAALEVPRAALVAGSYIDLAAT